MLNRNNHDDSSCSNSSFFHECSTSENDAWNELASTQENIANHADSSAEEETEHKTSSHHHLKNCNLLIQFAEDTIKPLGSSAPNCSPKKKSHGRSSFSPLALFKKPKAQRALFADETNLDNALSKLLFGTENLRSFDLGNRININSIETMEIGHNASMLDQFDDSESEEKITPNASPSKAQDLQELMHLLDSKANALHRYACKLNGHRQHSFFSEFNIHFTDENELKELLKINPKQLLVLLYLTSNHADEPWRAIMKDIKESRLHLLDLFDELQEQFDKQKTSPRKQLAY